VIFKKYIAVLMVWCCAVAVFAQAEATTTTTPTEEVKKEEGFNPTPMIMHHVGDSHEWDILELIHIPLPCIMYSSTMGGLSTFMYSEGQDINGYKCEEGSVSREDGASFLDFSITKNVLSMLLSAILLIVVFSMVSKGYVTNRGKAPKGIQAVIEPIVVFVRDEVVKPGIGPKYEPFMPYILTIFFFILANNLLGLMPIFPGGANVTGNIAFTMVLALTAFVVININGTKDYWGHIFWMPGVPVPLKIFLAPIEFLGIFIKPFALMMRLFANITAGHITILSMVSLIFIFGRAGQSIGGSTLGIALALPLAIFSSLLEVLVAFLQPFIFAMLTSVFIGMAMEEHHHEEAHH
jgi:F-type H+-transporting ATPase subunit a